MEYYTININHTLHVDNVNDMKTDDLLTAEKIKSSTDLTNYLRGQQGYPGPPGPKGEDGATGPKGPKGDSDSKSWLSWLINGITTGGTIMNTIAGSGLITGIQDQIYVIQGQVLALDGITTTHTGEITAIQTQLGILQTNMSTVDIASMSDEVFEIGSQISTIGGRITKGLRSYFNTAKSISSRAVSALSRFRLFGSTGGGSITDSLIGLAARDININLLSLQSSDVSISAKDKNSDTNFVFPTYPDIEDDYNQLYEILSIVVQNTRFIESTDYQMIQQQKKYKKLLL